MARKRYDEIPDNHDRWLVSYADFITLLFAFFVVMYALSSVNEGKYRVLSNSLVAAFGRSGAAPLIGADGGPLVGTEGGTAVVAPVAQQRVASEALRREREELTGIARDILKILAPLVGQGKVRVTQNASGVAVEINASVLFAQGDARLSPETSDVLRAVATLLKPDSRAIVVEGHTDSVPINNLMFPSNWELSAVRASSVVRLFVDSGIQEERLTAVGKGATDPVADNLTVEGRSRNRRVAIRIMSRLPDPVTEVPVVQTAGERTVARTAAERAD